MSRADELVAAANSALSAAGDPDKAPGMAAYLKTSDPFFGVSAPVRRDVFKRLMADFTPANAAEYRAFVDALYACEHRETRYLALDVAQRFKRYIDLDAVDLFERLVRAGAWWDLVDQIASNLIGKLLKDHREEMTPRVAGYIEDDDLWIRRTAIIAQIKHRDETDVALLLGFCLKCIHEKDFFIRKAIGWALRAYSKTDPDAVLAFLEEHRDNMAGLSYREGAKHLRSIGLLE